MNSGLRGKCVWDSRKCSGRLGAYDYGKLNGKALVYINWEQRYSLMRCSRKFSYSSGCSWIGVLL